MANTEKAEMRSYGKTWVNILLIVGIILVGLAAESLGWVDPDDDRLLVLVICSLVFVLAVLRYPRIWPWGHRNLRIEFRLDDPEQKRKAGLLDDGASSSLGGSGRKG